MVNHLVKLVQRALSNLMRYGFTNKTSDRVKVKIVHIRNEHRVPELIPVDGSQPAGFQ